MDITTLAAAKTYTNDKVKEIINGGDASIVDPTLSLSGAAADAKITGDRLAMLSNYTTPQMFGAIGDGVTDDTIAIQQAIDTGYPVEFDKDKQYLVSGFTINRDIIINGNGATLMCSGMQQGDSGKFCFFVPESDELYDIKIFNLNIVVLNHIVGVFSGRQGKNLVIDGCYIEGNADNDPSITAEESPGANQGITLFNFSHFQITNNIVNNIRTHGISASEYNSNGVISGNKINNTGRGAIYVRANNKNIEVTKNEVRNAVRCFTVSDGAIDLYGAGNENIYINKNFVQGYGRQESQGVGIRIKGSKNVVCSENTVMVDESTNSFALIFTQDRYSVGCENIVIEKNHLAALEGKTNYMIRNDNTESPTKEVTIQNNYLLSTQENCLTGISIRRQIDGLSIIGNYIEGNKVAIEFFREDGHERTNVLCDGNRINNARVLFYGVDGLKFVNNYMRFDIADTELVTILKCSDILIDMNTLINTQETQLVSYSECSNLSITETNIFKASDGMVDLHHYTFVKNISGNTELSFDALTDSIVGIQTFGHTQQTINEGEEISPDNMIEYSSANDEGDLIIAINGNSCLDSCIKRGLPANKDLANCIDNNGQGWIADYRDWANGVDWHYVEEYVFTGDETVTDFSSEAVVVTWGSLQNDKKTLSSSYRRLYDMFSNAFESYNAVQERRFNVATDKGNSFVITGYNSFFTNAEGFKTMCKTLFDNGTPIKILYALKVPYFTPISSDELEAYKQISLSTGNNTVSNSNELFTKVVYLLNDDYSIGTQNMIANKIDNFVKGTVSETLTKIEPIQVQDNKTIIASNGIIRDRNNYSVSTYNISDFNTNIIRVTYSVSSDIVTFPAFMVVNANDEVIDMVLCATSKVGVYTDTYYIPESAHKIYVNTRMTQTSDVSLRKNVLQCLERETHSQFKDGVCQYTYSKEQIDQALGAYIADVANIVGGDA